MKTAIEIDPASDPIVHDLRDVDAARLSERVEPCCDIDGVAEDVAVFDEDVVEIDPDAERDPTIGEQRLVQSRNCCTQGGGTTHGLDDALELDEPPVARPSDDMPTEFQDLRLDDFGPQEGQSGEAFGFISRREAAIPGEQNCRKSARNALCRFVQHDSRAPFRKMRLRFAAPSRV